MLKHKDEILSKFIKVESYLKTQFGYTVKALVGDNAREQTGHAFTSYIVSKGISWEPSPPHTPQLNGVAESKNRRLIEPLVCIMTKHQLPKYL